MATTGEHKPSNAGYPASSQPATGTAYPYAAAPSYYPPPPPPPQPYYDPYYNASSNAISPARRFFRFIIIACVVFFVVAGIITLIFWLVLRPKVPTFAVSSAAVSNFNVSDSSRFLSGDFDFTLSVGNPNKKMSVDYKDVNAALGYRHEPIVPTYLPPFSQGKRSETVLPAKFALKDQYLRGDSAHEILKEKAGSDSRVKFRLRVFARVTFSSGGWRMRRRRMRVHCDDIGIQFGNSTNSSSGSMVGSSTKCHVHV